MDQTIPALVAATEKKVYTGTAARLLKLMGVGCSQAEACRACGVDDSYGSQLMKEASFVEQLNILVASTMAAQSQIDENYNKLEENMSKRLLELSQYVFDPDKALRLVKFANEAQRRVTPIGRAGANSGDGSVALKPVTLVLPTQIINNFTINPQGEIVGVNGEELATLPSNNMNNLVAKHKEAEKAKPLEDKTLKRVKNGPGQVDPYSDL